MLSYYYYYLKCHCILILLQIDHQKNKELIIKNKELNDIKKTQIHCM